MSNHSSGIPQSGVEPTPDPDVGNGNVEGPSDEQIVQAIIARKPAYGAPCNGCGLCCIATQCPVSVGLYGERTICPALEQAGDSFACGLMVNPLVHIEGMRDWSGPVMGEMFRLLIGADIGCDGEGPGEVVTDAQRERIRNQAREKISAGSWDARLLLFQFGGNGAFAALGGPGDADIIAYKVENP